MESFQLAYVDIYKIPCSRRRRLIEWKKEFNEERNRKQQEAAKSVKSRRR
jgi:hypothetical protein